jgi:hypothetical protein
LDRIEVRTRDKHSLARRSEDQTDDVPRERIERRVESAYQFFIQYDNGLAGLFEFQNEDAIGMGFEGERGHIRVYEPEA